MKLKIRTTLIASTIAMLLAGPVLAATDTSKVEGQSSAPTKAEPEHPAVMTPMNETQKMGAANVGANARATLGDNPLYTWSADDLGGVKVVDRSGDKVGEIKRIVLAADRKSAHAVIATGGFLGMGTHEILVSLDMLRPAGDTLQMSASKEEVAAMKAMAPGGDSLVQLRGGLPISGSIVEFSAFEPGKAIPGAAATTPKADVKPAAAPETPKAPQ